ncbi:MULTISPECIES: DUF433 domain-containing protein [unclassified Imperialibacter]|nr:MULTISPECIES: DUF433 domain-containing protein [unclassified Imperialibacter]
MYGKPVIRGTRIPVDLIVEKLRSGEKPQQIFFFLIQALVRRPSTPVFIGR